MTEGRKSEQISEDPKITHMTYLECEALKLLIKFAWGQHGSMDYSKARQLVIEALELDDSRPVDTDKRKAALNAFCEQKYAIDDTKDKFKLHYPKEPRR